jgi:phosphoribosylpyrophosphate synthetase
MITLKLKYFDNKKSEVIVPTSYSDNTSQVYKVKLLDNNFSQVTTATILWQYENEAELFHVCQLSDLLDSYKGTPKPVKILNVPFLPYGRQDKPINNGMTFAQYTFGKIINTLKFDRVISFDPHGATNIENFQRISANGLIKRIFEDNKYDVLAFPDGNACTRYNPDETVPSVNGIKYKDKYTGENQDYQLLTDGVELEGKRILVVDDILDIGTTFVKLAKLLQDYKPGELGLYTSHSIASKGLEHLKEAGYKEFYTTNSLVKNNELGIKIV